MSDDASKDQGNEIIHYTGNFNSIQKPANGSWWHHFDLLISQCDVDIAMNLNSCYLETFYSSPIR